MYRKSNGKLGFGLFRLINNAVPNFARDDEDDVDLSPKQQDDLFKWQISLDGDPTLLNEKSFFMGGIVGQSSVCSVLWSCVLSILDHGRNGATN